MRGTLDDLRIYNRALTAAEVSALYQQGTTPTITSITPTETVIGKPTTFEVRGQNLNPNMGFTVGDCAYSNVALAGGTPQLQKFVCTQFGSEGAKKGMVKTKPGGTKVFDFAVTAVTEPSPVQTALIKGQLKIGSKAGKQVILSAGSDVSACQTNGKGDFACQVPAGWTGTLKPEAKGVMFSPAVIAVQNAQGESVANNGQPIVGTTTDVFPVDGRMSKQDWVWLLTDPIGWHVDMSNGELNDLRAYEGRFSFRSSPVKANQYAAIQTTINMPQEGEVRFARRVSSYRGHGVLTFSIDGKTAATWSGEKPWARVIERVTAGQHTLRWVYKRDSEATAKGEDGAWIDDVSYNNLVQLGTTACAGVTQGTLNLMTINKPSCEQAQSYLAWLKVVRMNNLNKTNLFSKQIQNIEVTNETIQDSIAVTAHVMNFLDAKSVRDFIEDETKSLTFELASDYVPIVTCDGTQTTVCDEATDALYQVIEYGYDALILGGSPSALAGSTALYAIEKSFATYFNLVFAWQANTLTEKMNTAIIADSFLDEFYKGGMNLATMRKKYGVLSKVLDDLIDPFANAKGYSNAWWGTDYYKSEVLNIIDKSKSQVTNLVNGLK